MIKLFTAALGAAKNRPIITLAVVVIITVGIYLGKQFLTGVIDDYNNRLIQVGVDRCIVSSRDAEIVLRNNIRAELEKAFIEEKERMVKAYGHAMESLRAENQSKDRTIRDLKELYDETEANCERLNDATHRVLVDAATAYNCKRGYGDAKQCAVY